jgi:hypothetical protein
VTIFVMLLAGAVLFLRDRRQQNKELPSSAEGFYNMEPPKDPGSWFNAWDSRENLHSTGRAEITGNNGQIPDLPDASKRFGMLAEYDPSELPIVK